jgi:hypothetical protein
MLMKKRRELVAAHIRQLDVEKYQARPELDRGAQGLRGGCRHAHFMLSGLLQHSYERPHRIGMVFDDQNPRHPVRAEYDDFTQPPAYRASSGATPSRGAPVFRGAIEAGPNRRRFQSGYAQHSTEPTKMSTAQNASS